MATPARLHCSVISANHAAPSRALLLLHGILGSGSNLRRFAQHLVEAAPEFAAVLVDLRGHGRSAHGSPPHHVASCAADLSALEQTLELPVSGVIGHSFGGKVALSYYQRRPDLERVALLDSAPFARPERRGSDETLAILDLLEAAPPSFASRADFLAFIHRHGHSRAVADWLAMNLERSEEGFRLRVDIDQIRALLDDYFDLDLWPLVQKASARVDLVIAGRSHVYGAEEIAQAEHLAQHRPKHIHVHHLPNAGHWVHVDALDEVIAALTAT